jgi:integrase
MTRSVLPTLTRVRALTDQGIERAVAVIRQHSKCKRRDRALLLVLLSTAAKPLEIARLLVGDYLTEEGLVREESVMRADAAINGTERPLFFASTKVVAAVDAYLEERARRGQGTKDRTKYRGLDPDSRLFLTGDGRELPIKCEQWATEGNTGAEKSSGTPSGSSRLSE